MEIYKESVESRFLGFILVAPVAVGLTLLLVSSFHVAAVLSAVAFAAYGFTTTWYYVGTGGMSNLVMLEFLPRMVATLSAALLLYFSSPVWVYPATLLAAVVCTLALNKLALHRELQYEVSMQTFRNLSTQLIPTGSRLANGLYSAGALSLVASVAPVSTLVFAGYDRVQKSAINGLVGIPQALVPWVSGAVERLGRRQRVALVLDTAVAVAVAAGLREAMPAIVRYVFGGYVVTTPYFDLLASVGVGATLLSKAFLMHGLVPAGLERSAAVLLTVSSTGGVGLLMFGTIQFGVAGALMAILVTELAFVIGSLGVLLRYWKNHGQ